MKVTVIPTAKDIDEVDIKGKVVLVIDVLRATSTIVTALNNGAKEIIPAFTIEEAMNYKLSYPHYKVGGERKGIKHSEFNFGNSPLEYRREVIKNETIVITTTNGTRAIKKSESAKQIILLSFLNINAVYKTIAHEENIVIVCSGTNDHFSIDDGVCAGALIYSLTKNHECELNDMGLACVSLYESTRHDLHQLISRCTHYMYLKEIGCTHDLDYCLEENTINIVPLYHNGRITKLSQP